MKSLQNKIFLFFVLLLLLVQSIGLWTVLSEKQNQERYEINNRLNTAKTIFTELFDSRRDYLEAFAATAAQDYGIKDVFNEDVRSLLVALNNHRKRIDADMVMTVNKEGIISAQLVLKDESGKQRVRKGIQTETTFKYADWLGNKSQARLYKLDNALYQLSMSPIKIGSKIIGWLGFGFEIDRRLALRYKNITGLETSFILREDKQWNMIASSAENAQLSFAQQIVNGNTPDHYIAQSQLITTFEDSHFGVAMYGLRADLVEVLQGRWWQILMLIVMTLLVSLGGAYLIAASITKPIKLLVKQAKTVARGDYHDMIDLQDQSELGQLAQEFNAMQVAVLSREQAIEHRANHDPLTDLPNRNMLMMHLKELATSSDYFAVFHLNLSRLKDVNDTLGHDVGDQIIREAGARLSNVDGFRAVFHLGADEFILLSKPQTACNLNELIKRVEFQLEAPFDHECFCFQLQARIGIAEYPTHTDNCSILLQMADTALHNTRKSRQQVQVYDPALDINTVERLSLINDFKNAVSEGQLELHFQPKMDLYSGIITHMEALVRWRHPSLGLVPPDNFIPIAEQTGQINELTRWVFRTAMKQYCTWFSEGIDVNIAVNISPEDLRDPGFFEFICDTLQHNKIDPNKVTLEVTESAVVEDPESAIELLQKFKSLGIYLSVDDYGTGYSSLAQLKQLPVHELKIDKSFVQRLQMDQDDRIIVKSTIELAHNMGLTVVAEGIEDEFALQWLADNNCEKAQGYFISRPLPVMELTSWLKVQKDYNFARELKC